MRLHHIYNPQTIQISGGNNFSFSFVLTWIICYFSFVLISYTFHFMHKMQKCVTSTNFSLHKVRSTCSLVCSLPQITLVIFQINPRQVSICQFNLKGYRSCSCWHRQLSSQTLCRRNERYFEKKFWSSSWFLFCWDYSDAHIVS